MGLNILSGFSFVQKGAEMRHKEVTVNMRRFCVTQFTSIDEAVQNLPQEMVLTFINSCWQNTQMLKLSDALGVKKPYWAK